MTDRTPQQKMDLEAGSRVSKRDELASQLLELLYAAPGDGKAWVEFLQAFSRALSKGAVAYFASQGSEDRPGILAGGGSLGRADVRALMVEPSIPHPSIAELPLGAVFELSVEDEGFQKSVLFQEVLAPLGVRAGPGLIVVLERDVRRVSAVAVVLPSKEGWRPTASDRALVMRLAPHMVIARRLHVALARRSLDVDALLTIFDQLLLSVILLDAKGRVSFANRSAAELIGARPGLADPTHLGAGRDARTDALYDLMPRGRWSGREASLLPHPADERPLQILSTPLEWPDPLGGAAQRFARALFIGDPKRHSEDPIGNLRELYGLTPAEARLAILLVGDRPLKEAAAQLGIAHSTARTFLKSIFAKTGAQRQASLVRLLLSGPGQIRDDEARAGATDLALPAPRRQVGQRSRK